MNVSVKVDLGPSDGAIVSMDLPDGDRYRVTVEDTMVEGVIGEEKVEVSG